MTDLIVLNLFTPHTLALKEKKRLVQDEGISGQEVYQCLAILLLKDMDQITS